MKSLEDKTQIERREETGWREKNVEEGERKTRQANAREGYKKEESEDVQSKRGEWGGG